MRKYKDTYVFYKKKLKKLKDTTTWFMNLHITAAGVICDTCSVQLHGSRKENIKNLVKIEKWCDKYGFDITKEDFNNPESFEVEIKTRPGIWQEVITGLKFETREDLESR